MMDGRASAWLPTHLLGLRSVRYSGRGSLLCVPLSVILGVFIQNHPQELFTHGLRLFPRSPLETGRTVAS